MLLGFDIGGTKCAVILGSSHNERKWNVDGKEIHIVDKKVVATDKPVYDMIELLFETAENLLLAHDLNSGNITGIGISCGGPLSSKSGIVLSPPNLPGWDNIPIVEITKKGSANPSSCRTMLTRVP